MVSNSPSRRKRFEPTVDRRHRRKVLRRHATIEQWGAAGPRHVEDGVHDLAHRPFPGPACPRRRRHEGGDDLPLRIAQAASITQMIAAMPPAGGRRPHEALQNRLGNRLEAHPDPAIHTLDGSFKTASELLTARPCIHRVNRFGLVAPQRVPRPPLIDLIRNRPRCISWRSGETGPFARASMRESKSRSSSHTACQACE